MNTFHSGGEILIEDRSFPSNYNSSNKKHATTRSSNRFTPVSPNKIDQISPVSRPPLPSSSQKAIQPRYSLTTSATKKQTEPERSQSADLRHFQIRIDYLSGENNRLKQELEAKAAYITKLENYFGKTLQGKVQTNIVQEFAEQKNTYVARIKQLENELAAGSAELSKLREANNVLRSSIQIKREIGGFESDGISGEKISRILVELASEKQKVTTLSDEIMDMERRLDTANHEREALAEQCDELRIIRESNSKELTEQEVRMQSLQKEIDLLNVQKATYLRERGGLLDNLEKLRLRLDQFSEDATKNTDELGKMKYWKIECEMKDEELFEKRKENEALRRRVSELEIETAPNRGGITELRDRVKELAGEIDAMRKDQQQLREEAEYYKNRSIDLLREKEELRSTRGKSPPKGALKKALRERTKLKEALDDALSRCASLTIQEEEHQKSLGKLQTTVDGLIQSKNIMELNYTTQIQDLQEKCSRKNREIEELSREFELLRDDRHIARADSRARELAGLPQKQEKRSGQSHSHDKPWKPTSSKPRDRR